MKILKRLIIAIVILAVLFVIAGYAASRYINKELVEKQVTEATGREFKIEGELKPVFSLTPSVRAEKVSMANAPWGGAPKLASIGAFEVKVQLIPLLSKKIVIDKIVIDQADISLEKKGDKWNFDFEKTAEKNEAEKDKPVEAKKPLSFDISGLNITNSKLTVKQDGKPMNLEVKDLKFAPRKSGMGLDFDGTMDGKVLKVNADLPPLADLMAGKAVDTLTAKIQSGDIKVDVDGSVDLTAKKAVIKKLDVTKGDLKVSAVGDANTETQIVNLSTLNIQSGAIKLAGNLTVNAKSKPPYIKGSLSSDSIDLGAGKKSTDGKADDGEANKSGQLFSDDPLPFEAFTAANADLNVKVGSLKSGNLVLTNISTVVRLAGGTLSLAPLNAGISGGSIAGNISLSKASTRIALKAKNISMEKVLQEFAGMNDFKNGVTDADINLSGSGNSLAKITGSLSGSSKVSVGKAVYSGEILKGQATQLALLLTGGGQSKQVEINCILADINWSGGVGNFTKVGADTQYANITSTGNLRLPSGTLNLQLDPVSKLPKLNNLAIPVGVGGTIKNPKVAVLGSKVVEKVTSNLVGQLLAPKEDGKKKGIKVGSLFGVDKKAVIASPCGAAPATIQTETPATVPTETPATTTPAQQPAQPTDATQGTTAEPAPVAAEPQQPLTKEEKKAQKKQQQMEAIGGALKQFGIQ